MSAEQNTFEKMYHGSCRYIEIMHKSQQVHYHMYMHIMSHGITDLYHFSNLGQSSLEINCVLS